MAFPGAALFPAPTVGSDDDLIHRLYDGRLFVPGSEYGFCKPACELSVRDRVSWVDRDQHEHVGAVIAASPHPGNATHADGAYLGMVDLVRTAQGWKISAGSPLTTAEGSFGVPPPVEMVTLHAGGLAVITKPGNSSNGETEQSWHLYVERTGARAFQKVFSIPIVQDNSGRCGRTPACRRYDFTTQTTLVQTTQGLVVHAVRTSADGSLQVRDYRVGE